MIQVLSYLQSEGVTRQGADPLRQADHSAHGWQESLQIDRLKVEAGEAELLSQREGPKRRVERGSAHGKGGDQTGLSRLGEAP